MKFCNLKKSFEKGKLYSNVMLFLISIFVNVFFKNGPLNYFIWGAYYQVISNINACQAIVDAIRTTLGPRGMDKLMVDGRGAATISNDGATIMKLLDVVHPAAKTLVDIAKSQVDLI